MASESSATAKKRTAQPPKNAWVSSSVSVEDRAFLSTALGREVRYRVVLPSGYANSGHRYPVLFLLHGVFGGFENWETLTNLSRYAASPQLVIVTPDGANSWYVNSASDPAERYEDFFMQDLLPDVEASFRTLRSSHRRAIAGLSMGGYGALKFALKYPGTFDFAGSISGAFNGPFDLDQRRADLRGDLLKAFGPPGSSTRQQNEIFELLESADPGMLPYFYLDCGASDEFCDVNRRLAQVMRERGARYEYHDMPGTHSWQYWDERIAAMLPVVSKKIAAA